MQTRSARRVQVTLRLEQRLCITNGNAKVGAAEAANNSKRHANHLAVAVNQRSAGATRSGLRVVNNLIRQDVAYVALGHERPNAFTLLKCLDNSSCIAAGALDDVLHRVFAGAREDRADARCVPQRNQW